MEKDQLLKHMKSWGFNPNLVTYEEPWKVNHPPGFSSNIVKFLNGYIEKFPGEGKGIFLFGTPRLIHYTLSQIVWQLLQRQAIQSQAFLLDVPTYIVDQFHGALEGDLKEQQLKIKTQLKNSNLFVFDEVALSSWTPNQQLRVYAMVNTRYQLGLPSIFTSSKTMDETVDSLIDSIYFRIEESCTFLELPRNK